MHAPASASAARQASLPVLLRAATAAAHARIEANPVLSRLLADDLSRDEYAAILARLHGHHAPAEAAIAAWAATAALPAGLHLDRRLDRTGRLAADLAALGVSPHVLPRAVVPRPGNDAEAWGLLYVLEGSVLGGQVIARQLQRRLAIGPASGAGFFAPPGAGARWRSFRALLEASALPATDVAGAANAAFARLDEWMAGAG